MPQFDFVSFFGQVFWILLQAFTFYLFLLAFYGKDLSELLKVRTKISNFALVIKDKIQSSDLYDQIMKFIRRR